MTKWGRKNTSSSSSLSSTSNNVFFKSWLSRFKNTKGGDQNQPQSSWISDDEWRVSFEKEKEEEESFKILCNSDHKLNVSPIANYGSFIFDNGTKTEEDQNRRKSVHIRSKSYNSPRRDFGRMIKDDRRVVVEDEDDAFRAGLDSFAIVKTSYDPNKDFRESMMEMIMAKKLRKADELEELLACYLTLNCDGIHDLIVNVFRQVWFELNQLHFHQQMEFN